MHFKHLLKQPSLSGCQEFWIKAGLKVCCLDLFYKHSLLYILGNQPGKCHESKTIDDVSKEGQDQCLRRPDFIWITLILRPV